MEHSNSVYIAYQLGKPKEEYSTIILLYPEVANNCFTDIQLYGFTSLLILKSFAK